MRKLPVFKGFVFVLLVYIIYQGAVFLILGFQITNDKNPPKMKLSEMINIPEERIQYTLNNYIRKDFVGFNAIIDKKYFITVTKLGKISSDYKMSQTSKQPKEDPAFNFFSFSDVEDKSGRYIDLNNFPFNTKKNYYYVDKENIFNINQSEFYEVEGDFSFLNISFGNEYKRDFGYGGYQGKQSISFINHKGNLYVLNLIPIGSSPYISLHDLSKI